MSQKASSGALTWGKMRFIPNRLRDEREGQEEHAEHRQNAEHFVVPDASIT